MKYIIIVFFLISTNVFAQNAAFHADINTLNEALKDGFDDLREKALAMTWIVNGKELSYGSKTVHIKPNRYKLDTIIFKKNASSKADTILCNISKAGKYNLGFNTCCGDFYVSNISKSKKIIKREKSIVSFKAVGNKPNKKFLGTIGNAGILIEKDNTAYQLFHTCASAMSSNIYKVAISEVEVSKDYNESFQLLCLFTNNNKQVSQADNFIKIKEQVSFLYLPLDDTSLNVVLDIETNILTLKSVR